jgi:hypothetical protein
MLEHVDDIQNLIELALKFDSAPPGARRLGNNRNFARESVLLFLRSIRAKFPTVIIDHRMTDMNNLGTYPRGRREGGLPSFNPRQQMIF